ncbi:MAG: hypothetical protein ACK4FG_02005 [Brevundimonas sp.]
MAFTPEELKKLHEDYGGDIEKVALAVGVTAPAQPTPMTRPRRLQRPAELGNPNLRRYIVSARHVEFSTWPSQDEEKILQARANYEAGTHEMCQGRDQDWFILYSIPRKVRTGARKFFHMEDFS